MTPTKPMSSKKNQESRCGQISPGPHVNLKPVFGCKNHCLSKPRNPCYSIGLKVAAKSKCIGPGPAKYALPGMKAGHMSFGRRTEIGRFCTPGPYYIQELKCPKNPGFTIGIKTKPRVGTITPGPYELFVNADEKRGFTFGKSVAYTKTASPGPYDLKFSLVEQRSPAVIFPKSTYKQPASLTPGFSYMPPYKPKPAFTFGIKHSPCSRPYFTDQDDKC